MSSDKENLPEGTYERRDSAGEDANEEDRNPNWRTPFMLALGDRAYEIPYIQSNQQLVGTLWLCVVVVCVLNSIRVCRL